MACCPQCGTEIPEGSTSCCPSCGVSISAESAVPTELAAAQKGRRNKLPFIIVVAALLLIIVVVCWKFILNSRQAYVAVLAPKETDVFFVVNPDLGQKKNAENIRDAFLAVPEGKKAWDGFQKGIEDNRNISYERDIKPWLGGEAACYITDIDFDIDIGEKYVFALATKDKKKSNAFMEKVCKGKACEKETYKGIEIITGRDDVKRELSYAHIKKYMVVASSKQPIRQAIDNSQNKGMDSLSEDESYKKALVQLPKSRLGSAYLSSDVLKQNYKVKEYLKHADTELLQGVGISFSCEKEGIRVDYIASYGDGEAEKTGNNIAATMGITPGDVVAYMGIANMKAGFEEIADYVEEVSRLRYYNPFDNAAVHIRELAGLMNGEMAVIILRDNNALHAGSYNENMGMCVFVFGVQDIAAVNLKMQELVKNYIGSEVHVDTIRGNQVFYVDKHGKELFCYGLRDNNLIAASSPETLCCVLETTGCLSENNTFKKAVSNISPSEMDCCLYLDVTGVADLIRCSLPGILRGEFDKDVYPLIKPVKGAAFSSIAKMKANKGTLFIEVGV